MEREEILPGVGLGREGGERKEGAACAIGVVGRG
jgi:hypothetical protein